jgi:PAS domain S-box-containing protein
MLRNTVGKQDLEGDPISPELLVEALPLVAYAADPSGRVTRVNRRWLEYTGLTSNESLGLSGTDVIHPDDLSKVLEHWGRAVRNLEPYQREYRLRRSDGVYRWHLGRAEPVFGFGDAPLGWIGTATDIHDTRIVHDDAGASMAELEIALRRLEALQRLTAALSRAATPQEVYASTLEQAIQVMGMRAGGFTLVRGDTLEIVAALGQPPEVIETQRRIALDADHPLAETARSGQALYFHTAEARKAKYPHLVHLFSPATRSSVFVPLLAPSGVIGVLTLSFPDPHAFDDEERAFVGALADSFAQALERSRLLEAERVARTEAETAKAQLEAMLDNVPVGLAFFDRDLRYVRVNAEIAKLNARSKEDHLGRTLEEVLPRASEVLRPKIEAVFATRTGAYGVEVSGPRQDDPTSVGHALASWFPVTLEGETLLVGAAVLDISERKRAEEALRRSEERLRLSVEVADFAIAEVDYLADTIHFSSQAAALYGFGEGERIVPRARVHAIFHPDERAALEARITEALNPDGPGCFACEHRVVLPNGEERWLNVRKQFRFEGLGQRRRATRAILVAQDITQRKRRDANLEFLTEAQTLVAQLSDAEEIVRVMGARVVAFLGVSHCLFVEIAENAQEVVVIHEHRTAGEPKLLGTFRLEDYHTLPERERIRSGGTIVIDDVRDGSRAADMVRNFERIEIRALATTPFVSAGRWRFALSALHHQPRAWREDEIELLRDLATLIYPRLERSRAEAALREREMLYRTFFNSVDEGFCVCEMILDDAGKPRDYRFLEINRLFAEQTGLRDAVGRTALELVPNLEPHWIELYGRVALTGEPARFEQGSDVMGRWFDVYACRVGDEGSLQFAILFKDVTERRRAEQRLLEINEAQRRFVSDAAHELRAPLTAIQGNLELIERFPNMNPEDRNASLSDAAREAARLGRLVTDMLALARGDAGRDLLLSPLRLDAILEQVFNTMRPLATQHRLEHGAFEAVVVEGHRDRLSQLVMILLENALKYTPTHGTVRLESRVNGDHAEFRVIDTGPGIATEDLERVFERFFRADKSRARSDDDPGGTGLGLPIARWITEQHGGKVWLESEVGMGTTAVVQLPLAAGAALG